MKFLIKAIIIFSLSAFQCSIHKSKAHYPDPDQNIDELRCAKTHNYSSTEKLSNYPFNKAAEIKLVSFGEKFTDTTLFEQRLPAVGGKIDLSKPDENVTLTGLQVDDLTDILFNFGYPVQPKFLQGRGCYDPRNAILFIGSDGQVFEFIEVCFKCHEIRLSSPNVSTGEFCIGKYELVKAFFKGQGIAIGTKDRD